MSSDVCILCKKPLDDKENVVRVLKGLPSLINASEQRCDGFLEYFRRCFKDSKELTIHCSCRKSYTRATTIKKDRRLKSIENHMTVLSPALRSSTPAFDIKTGCIFCGCDASIRKETKKEVKYRRVIHEVSSLEFEKSVSRRAEERNDAWGAIVQNRIECIVDLVAADAKYHHDCYRTFFSPGQQSDENSKSAGRQEDQGKKKAFDKLCDYINNSRDNQFSMPELEEYCQSLLSSDEKEGYCRRRLKDKIVNRFQERILVTEIPGKPTIFRFKDTADSILHNKWYTERKTANDVEERVRIVEAAAAVIREEIAERLYDTSTYSCVGDSSMVSEQTIPDLLNVFLKNIIVSKSTQQNNVKRQVAAIGQAIVSSCRPRTFVSPLLLGIGVSLHVQHGSRELIDLLHSFSFSASYKEVKRYESSVMEESSRHDQRRETGYVHFAFDNADFNVRTLTGHGTFHSLGGVSFTTPAGRRSTSPIPRILKPCSKDTVTKGVTAVSWYKKRAHGLQDIIAEDLKLSEELIKPVREAVAHDALWITGRWALPSLVPAWNGFMRTSMKTGELYLPVPKTGISAVPFINLPPSDPSAIFSALKFAEAQCVKRGQRSCLVTFDQPLYIKALNIVSSAPPGELDLVTVRLGGFHLLMSFMGAIGFVMSGSGLEELWELIYAKSSVQHMISGHAYSRALRAHFLTQEALASVLLSRDPLLDEEKSHLELLCRASLEGKLTPREVCDNELVTRIMEFIDDKIKSTSEGSRTAKLWAEYYRQVEILRLYIRAERTSNWNLHLYCVSEMLPYFHAAGHIHYAKSSHLYLQQMLRLDEKMPLNEYIDFTVHGYFSIRRSHDFWSGVWSDMAIEQDLMRPMKSRGGLTRGRGVDDCALAHFVSAFPLCIPICKAVEEVSGIKTNSSEQHVELRDSRRKLEIRHANVFRSWLEDRSPWDPNREDLQSLSTGVLADDKVNCDTAREIGEKAVKQMVGKSFEGLKVARKNRVVPLSAVGCQLKIREDIVPVNPHQLFMRIICVMKSEKDIAEFLKYELAPTPPSLFDSTSLRKTAKSALQDIFESSDAPENLKNRGKTVVDGGLLLHTVVWPRPATFGDIFQSYKSYIAKHYPSDLTIVFDSYDHTPSTKNQEQARRAGKRTSIDIVFDSKTMVSTSQADFLSNTKNKGRFILALASELRNAGVKVHQAAGDADTLIVDVALSLDAEGHAVTVIASDTDVLCMLLAKASENSNIDFCSPGNSKTTGKMFAVKSIQQGMGAMKRCLLFSHAVSGCDTTSAIFGKGKKRPWSLLKNNEDLRKTVEIFNKPGASKEDITSAGEKFLLELFNGKDFGSLNDLRVHLYGRTIARQTVTASFDLATLPPTSDACHQHSLRTYLQVQEWLGNKLPATEWGWRSTKSGLQPIPMITPPAPDSLLQLVSCNCKGACASRCECRRSGLECSWMCGKCRGVTCENGLKEIDFEEGPDDF